MINPKLNESFTDIERIALKSAKRKADPLNGLAYFVSIRETPAPHAVQVCVAKRPKD